MESSAGKVRVVIIGGLRRAVPYMEGSRETKRKCVRDDGVPVERKYGYVWVSYLKCSCPADRTRLYNVVCTVGLNVQGALAQAK